MGAEIGGPAGDVRLHLLIEAAEGLHQLRDQQGQRQHQHKDDPQQSDKKAEQADGLIGRLLFSPAEQLLQPLFQSGHGHIDEQCQNAAGKNGQNQIHQLTRKGEHGRKTQQRHKKRDPYNSHQQILFCFWFHDDVPFPEPVAAICKIPSGDSFSYCNQKKWSCQDGGTL